MLSRRVLDRVALGQQADEQPGGYLRAQRGLALIAAAPRLGGRVERNAKVNASGARSRAREGNAPGVAERNAFAPEDPQRERDALEVVHAPQSRSRAPDVQLTPRRQSDRGGLGVKRRTYRRSKALSTSPRVIAHATSQRAVSAAQTREAQV